MNRYGLSLIAGSTGRPGRAPFHAVNAESGEVIEGSFHSAYPDEVNAAAEAAGTAYEEYRKWNGERRAALLHAIAERLEAESGKIIERADSETALGSARLQGELARTCSQLRFFGRVSQSGQWADVRVDPAQPGRLPQASPDVRSLLQPIGPVAVFGASNFPLAFSVAGGDTASALAAGCPVIVKAHPMHPGTSEIVGHAVSAAMTEIGAPAGTFSLLFDAGYDVALQLVRHPNICAVGFTGSFSGGTALIEAALKREVPIPVFAEMSSVNPVFILPNKLSSEPELLATAVFESMTLGVGQFCTNPGIVVLCGVEGAGRFKAKVAELAIAAKARAMLAPGFGDHFRAGLAKLSEHGASPLVVPNGQSGALPTALTIDADGFSKNSAFHREVFGPSTLIVEAVSLEQAEVVARSLKGNLTASIHGLDSEIASATNLAAILSQRVGRLIWNQFPTGVEVCDAMVHGGPYPSTSDARTTSVGGRAILRWVRPVCYQNMPTALLPPELR